MKRKILYLHGFQSSKQSNTIKYFEENLINHEFYSLDLPHKPEEAIKLIDKTIKELGIDILIGTSLGGLYAYNFDIPKICINPGFEFNIKTGTYQYFNEREDGEVQFDIEQSDVDYLTDLVNSYKTREPFHELYHMSFILIGKQDTYITYDHLDEFINEYDKVVYADFEHRLPKDIAYDYVFPMIEVLSKSINTLMNSDILE